MFIIFKWKFPIQCPYCPKVILTGAGMHSHLYLHERMSQMTHPTVTKAPPFMNGTRSCTPPPSPTKPRSKSHLNEDGESYFTCRKCYKVFSSKSNLKCHMKSHQKNASIRSPPGAGKQLKQQVFWCDVCHIACRGYEELQKHKMEHDDENMPELESQVRS